MDLVSAVRLVTAAFFVFAGAMHFVKPAFYLYIMPPWVPRPVEMVWLSGFFEIAGGVGLLVPALRVPAAWGLIALLWAVFPANIHMAVNRIVPPGMNVPTAALWFRLPLQFVLMYVVWWCAIRAS